MSVVCSSTRSEQRLSLSVSLVFLRDGVTLWVKCVLRTLLITIEGLPLAVGSCSFRLGSHAGYCCLRLVFPWLCIIVCLCASLLFTLWLLLLYGLLSLGIHSLFRCVVTLSTGSSSLISLFSLGASSFSLSLSLPLGPLLEVIGWSSGPFVALCGLFGFCFLVGSHPGGPFLVSLASAPRVWGFQDVSLVFSFQAPLLPFLPSQGLLRCRGTLSALCLAPFCQVFDGFVCRLRAVLLLSPVPVSRVILLVLPLSLRVLTLSLCLLALLFVLFLGRSSLLLAVSFLLLPCLPLQLFLPLLCLLRRGLLVCLLLQLRRRLRVLLPCPLFWRLPLGLPFGFHLLLSFCCAVLLLAWFSWGPVVPARVVVLFFYIF